MKSTILSSLAVAYALNTVNAATCESLVPSCTAATFTSGTCDFTNLDGEVLALETKCFAASQLVPSSCFKVPDAADTCTPGSSLGVALVSYADDSAELTTQLEKIQKMIDSNAALNLDGALAVLLSKISGNGANVLLPTTILALSATQNSAENLSRFCSSLYQLASDTAFPVANVMSGLSGNVDVNALSDGDAPVHALLMNNIEDSVAVSAVVALKAQGAILTLQNVNEKTPLYYVVDSTTDFAMPDTLSYLLSNGVKDDVVFSGKTALMVLLSRFLTDDVVSADVCAAYNAAAVQLINSGSSSLTATDLNGKTPLDYVSIDKCVSLHVALGGEAPVLTTAPTNDSLRFAPAILLAAFGYSLIH